MEAVKQAVDWNDIVRRAHKMAVEKGWWTNPRSTDDIAANFHAEVSEAWEEYRRDGEECLKSPYVIINEKPEGFFVEIADLLIRVADYCGHAGFDPGNIDEKAHGMVLESTVASFVCHLHGVIASTFPFLSPAGNLNRLFYECVAFANAHGVTLSDVIEVKMAYNATREHRHGGKHA